MILCYLFSTTAVIIIRTSIKLKQEEAYPVYELNMPLTRTLLVNLLNAIVLLNNPIMELYNLP